MARSGGTSTPRAVRVYTVNDESRYVVVRNIPAIGVVNEALKKLSLYGDIVEQRPLGREHEANDAEAFTESLWVKYETVNNARHAKNRIKNKPVYGSILDVKYAPEHETAEETASKLRDRRELIERRAAPRAPGNRTTGVARPRPVEEKVVDEEFIGPQLPSVRPVVVVQAANTIPPPPPKAATPQATEKPKRRRI